MEKNMLKKYSIYLVILITGMALGYIFSDSKQDNAIKEDIVVANKEVNWSCSMHPQINAKEKGSCPLCGMDLTIASQKDGELEAHQFKMTKNALALANVETTIIGLGNLNSNTILLSGEITTNEKTNAIQTTLFDGRIEKLVVNYVGQYVKKGQLVGYIYSPELYAAQDKLLTSVTYKDTHKKLYNAARNTLGLWKMTDEQIDAMIASGTPMMRFPIYADVSGTVTEIIAAEGNWYKQGDSLYKVANLYTVWAVFDAYENQLPFLKIGQNITITSNAFKGEELKSKIAFIEPVLNVNSRTVAVRVTLNNKKQHFKPGMFLQGKINIPQDGNKILTTPKSTVLWTGKRSIVYVKPNPKESVFEMREVILGNVLGDSYIVLDGLIPGDEVVTNGAFTIDAAAQLQGKKSMMSNSLSQSNVRGLNDESGKLVFNANLQSELPNVISTYIELKDFLVATDSNKSMGKAKELMSILLRVNESVLDKETKQCIVAVRTISEKISKTMDIKEQRKQFKGLSKNMVAIAEKLSKLDQPIYVQYCPMADNNKGATWLSFSDEVFNPYYGDKMLHCGSVTKTIQ
ncbi:Cu(I)/Ag(I) efflux system membrane fusion protein [Maribacter vaceletii]|uniref:Cu(I)/Ag(I) efflux system membrane fusion protein n=1 Tax=Maribacter vaceletii TaxID=1206816 RepID=A0A495DTH3_9FLAO|nr:efflux RND transporter periplasmic adaptor subunit [Maribacter vaceletii]RKR07708.1 Cu(I)/Ag(I) efflux system membrane fusion protein [Maribacter vaceletii]